MYRRSIASLVCIVVLFCGNPLGAWQSDEIRDQIRKTGAQLCKQHNVPGLAVALIKNGKVAWTEGIGMANVEEAVPVTETTIFNIGSISKPVAAWGFMKLVEQETIDLDTPVNQYLTKWKLPESEFDANGVTLKRLLSHTTGLSLHGYPGFQPGEDLPTLEESLSGATNGRGDVRLIHEFRYSNLGYALLGHILELASEKSHEELLRETVIDPLEMTSTGIYATDEHEQRLAAHYWPRETERVARPRYEFGEIVGHGGVHSSMGDLSKYVLWQLVSGEQSSVRPETLRELHQPVIKMEDDKPHSIGTDWFIYRFPGVKMIEHSGGTDGHSATIAFLPEYQVGLIVLANTGNDASGSIARPLLRTIIRPER